MRNDDTDDAVGTVVIVWATNVEQRADEIALGLSAPDGVNQHVIISDAA